MSFRRRLALSCAGAVAFAVVLGSVLAYFIVRGTLRGQIDSALRGQEVRCDAPAPTGGGGNVMFRTDTPANTRLISKGQVGGAGGEGERVDSQEMEDVPRAPREPFFADCK